MFLQPRVGTINTTCINYTAVDTDVLTLIHEKLYTYSPDKVTSVNFNTICRPSSRWETLLILKLTRIRILFDLRLVPDAANISNLVWISVDDMNQNKIQYDRRRHSEFTSIQVSISDALFGLHGQLIRALTEFRANWKIHSFKFHEFSIW